MARAPRLSLRREDFQDLSPANLDRFFRAVNGFASDVRAALTRGISDGDNTCASLREVTLSADSKGTFEAMTIAHGLPAGTRPQQVTIVQAFKTPAQRASVPVALYGPGWVEGENTVIVSDIGGLAPSCSYRILLCIRGA